MLVGNSVLEEGQPVSEQHGLYVDWKGMPTAGGRNRKKKGKLAIPKGLIAEMKVKGKGKVTKARCSPQKNGSGIDDFSDDE